MQETWVRYLHWEDPQEEGMALQYSFVNIYSNILAWRIPMDRGPGGLEFMGLQRVRQD